MSCRNYRKPLFTMFLVHAAAMLLVAATTATAFERPNILLIITDQQSADVMSCRMGDTYLRTPAMDSLARDGMLFTRAYTPNPLCMPARNSIFTGRYPHETGVTMNARPEGGNLASEFICMGTYLRQAGYTTAYSGKWHLCLPEKKEKSHGFEILDSKQKLVPPAADNYDSRVAHAAVQFLSRPHEKPYLLVASFMNPHNICEWARRGAGREQTLSCGEIGTPPSLDQLPPVPANLEVPDDEPDGMLLIRRAYQVPDGPFPVAQFTDEDWRKQRWGYYRMVEKVDGEIAKLLETLRATGQEENTVIIFTSDHGDCVGAHRFNQKTVFYDESSRIPLIIRWKEKTHGGTTDRLVNTGTDILPTILGCAGIQAPSQLSGCDLLPLALGAPIDTWRSHIVVQNNMSQTGVVDGFKPHMQGRMVRTQRFKYCVYEYGQNRESLYDMQNDPLETTNLAGRPEYRSVLQEHRELLRQFAAEHHDALVAPLLDNDVQPKPFPKS